MQGEKPDQDKPSRILSWQEKFLKSLVLRVVAAYQYIALRKSFLDGIAGSETIGRCHWAHVSYRSWHGWVQDDPNFNRLVKAVLNSFVNLLFGGLTKARGLFVS